MSAREDLLEAMEDSLQLINGAGQYTNSINPSAVSRELVTFTQFAQKGLLPGLALIDKGDEVFGAASSQVRTYRLSVSVVIYAKSQSGVDSATKLNSYISDVIKAMTSPTTFTHNSNTWWTEYLGGDVFADIGEGGMMAMLDFKASYRNTWTTP